MKRVSTALLAAAGAVALAAAPAAAGPVNTNSADYWSATTGLACVSSGTFRGPARRTGPPTATTPWS